MIEKHYLTIKCIKVFNSCITILQIQTALKYAHYAQKRISNELNIEFHIVNKQFKTIMFKQDFNHVIQSYLVLL